MELVEDHDHETSIHVTFFSLKTKSLACMKLEEQALQNLISRCPFIEDLHLLGIHFEFSGSDFC